MICLVFAPNSSIIYVLRSARHWPVFCWKRIFMNYLNLNCPPLPYYLGGGECTYAINEKLQAKQENAFTLIYVRQGQLTLKQETVTAQLDAGDYFIATPNSTYCGCGLCAEKTTLYWLNFKSSLAYSLSDTCADVHPNMAGDHQTASQLFVISVARHSSVEKHNRPHFEEMLRSLTSEGYNRRYKGGYAAGPVRLFDLQISFIQLLSLLHAQEFSYDSKLNIAERLHDYIDKHYIEDIRLGVLAKQYSYSPSHLIRCFNEAYGLSPMQYVKKLRMEKAKNLLDDTNLPVQVIANESGFNITSYFIKQFKKEYGTTPARYRAVLNPDKENSGDTTASQ